MTVRTCLLRICLPIVLGGVLGGRPTAWASASPSAQADPSSRSDGQQVAVSYLPDLAELMRPGSSEMRDVIERYAIDRETFFRFQHVPHSSTRREAARSFYREWLNALAAVVFDAMGIDGRTDWLLLRNQLLYELALLDREERRATEMEPLLPFRGAIVELREACRRMQPVAPREAARQLTELDGVVERTQKALAAGRRPAVQGGGGAGGTDPLKPIVASRTVAYRASRVVADLRQALEQWFKQHHGYDPLFTWWASKPYQSLDERLKAYEKYLREEVVGFVEGQDDPVVGDPIGREALSVDLAHEMIPYLPEQLMSIAREEFAWCEREMLRAAQELGYGDDWRAAVERVKDLHVDPGKQPSLIREQALEAIAFVEQRDLLTVPPLAKDAWRIEMMSPERQKLNPFFLGGEVIRVSFPTDGMTHEEKTMSMRGNNVHFARATVHHELIPGHHLQGFMNDRYNPHRRVFDTPFWAEGWALYWEMRLWDLGFPKTAENRIGMLFWRMHRCARILFSLGFHLGEMTPEQCIDLLVERVGHERRNAVAEVRRSFEGSYPPLYQAAYMIGGIQFRALHRELVGSGRMSEKQFHDAILRSNNMPVEMVRALLTGEPPSRQHTARWLFSGEVAAGAAGPQ